MTALQVVVDPRVLIPPRYLSYVAALVLLVRGVSCVHVEVLVRLAVGL